MASTSARQSAHRWSNISVGSENHFLVITYVHIEFVNINTLKTENALEYKYITHLNVNKARIKCFSCFWTQNSNRDYVDWKLWILALFLFPWILIKLNDGAIW